MEPHILPKDKELFYRYLDTATNYFEFGSGGSTAQAALRPNIQQIWSVESDPLWIQNVQKSLSQEANQKVAWHFVDLHTTHSWGGPGSSSTLAQRASYSQQICLTPSPGTIDLLLIDGRFRVACALKAFSVISDTCVVLFDDFLNRPQYHIVLQFYEVVEQTTDKVMARLRKKPGVAAPPESVIKLYELNAN